MLQCENNSQNDAHGANDNVGVSQERILAAKPARSRNHDVFVAAKRRHREVVADLDSEIALERLIDDAVELAEGRQASDAHPVDEVGVLQIRNRADTLRLLENEPEHNLMSLLNQPAYIRRVVELGLHI